MNEMLNEICQILLSCWKWDIWWYSQPWVYYPLFIPAVCYIPFMLIKWTLLTCPLWLPVTIIIKSIMLPFGMRRVKNAKAKDEPKA